MNLSTIRRMFCLLPVFVGIGLTSMETRAALSLDMSEAMPFVRVTGLSITRADVYQISAPAGGLLGFGVMRYWLSYNGTLNGVPATTPRMSYVAQNFERKECPAALTNRTPHTLTSAEEEIMVAWANEIAASGTIVLQNNGSVSAEFVPTSVVRRVITPWIQCHWELSNLASSGVQMRLNDGLELITPVPPPFETVSVCTFANPSISLDFTSNTTSVSGVTQTTSVPVTCSTGTPTSYKIRLAGSNVQNGNLLFPNGVAVGLSFDGMALSVNNTGVNLPNLASGSHTLTGVLTGTAPEPGVSTTTGILILETL